MCRYSLAAVLALSLTPAAWAASPTPVLTLMVQAQPAIAAAESATDTSARPVLSLETPDQLPLVNPVTFNVPDVPATNAILTLWQSDLPREEAQLKQTLLHPSDFDRLLDSLGNVFDAQDIEWPTGTLSTVHILPPGWADPHLTPFVSLMQDADERDAHLRNGAGVGLTYRIDRQSSINAELIFLDTAGDVNPATSSETRFMITWTTRF